MEKTESLTIIGSTWTRQKQALLADASVKYLLGACAILMSIIVLVVISFVAQQGLATFTSITVSEFFLQSKWDPESGSFGGLSFIIGSFQVTVLSILVATPLALACSIFLANIAPKTVKNILRPAVDLYVGIPSIVYGYLGLTLLIPALREMFDISGGFGLMPAVLVLAVMILPTIITLSEDAINAVPQNLAEASIALGATRFQTIYKVIVPSAATGIVSAVILAMARAIGETMAVQMLIGNTPVIARNLFTPTATLTSNIVLEMGNAPFNSTWNNALFLMALLLLIMALFTILIIRYLVAKGTVNHAR